MKQNTDHRKTDLVYKNPDAEIAIYEKRCMEDFEKDVPRHLPIGLNAMFKAIELPARITHLNPSLSYVNAYHLSHRSLSLSL